MKKISPGLPLAYGQKTESYRAINILALESRKIIEFQTKRKSLDTKLFMKEKERMLGGIYKFIQFL